MNNQIKITYDQKSKRLVFQSPFHLVDVLRSFPSRRFDPKSKTWRVPLLKSNINHLNEIKNKYDILFDDEAKRAVTNHEALMAKPVYVPFPRHLYDFKKSPTGFTPMEHQDKMLDLSYGLKASAWFAKMGTGKTFAAIHLAMARWRGGEIDALVIICPSTLRRTWLKEFAKYATSLYDFKIHETSGRWYAEFCADRPTDTLQVLAVSVEGLGVSTSLYDSVCAFFANGKRIMIICDESSRIKNPEAIRTKRVIELGAVAQYRLILNGTPIALGVQDLWSQFEFLDPNIIGLGDYWAYRTRYLVMGGYENRQIVGVQHMDELMNLLIPYTCEVGKDVLNLPPKIPTERYIQITPEQKRLLRLIVRGADSDPNAPQIKVENSLEKILRCRQVVGGWLPRAKTRTIQIDGIDTLVTDTILEPLKDNPKLDSLLELIDDNRAGTKFIIWSTFTHEITAIATQLQQLYGPDAVACYFGGTAMEGRSAIEDRYCNDPTLRFFIGNPSAAGLGLTLISGENDLMVYYSGTNAYIDRAQSEDRAHRIGQKNSVTIVDLIAERTVDEAIIASIREKMDIETYILQRIKAGITLDDLLLGE